MNHYTQTLSERNAKSRPQDAELLTISAVRAIRRRVAVSPSMAVTIAGLIGFAMEGR